MIRIVCINCGQKLSAEDAAAGRRAKCPKCGAVLSIPSGAPFEPIEANSESAAPGTFGHPSGRDNVPSRSSHSNTTRCPYCSEEIPGGVAACPLCHKSLPPGVDCPKPSEHGRQYPFMAWRPPLGLRRVAKRVFNIAVTLTIVVVFGYVLYSLGDAIGIVGDLWGIGDGSQTRADREQDIASNIRRWINDECGFTKELFITCTSVDLKAQKRGSYVATATFSNGGSVKVDVTRTKDGHQMTIAADEIRRLYLMPPVKLTAEDIAQFAVTNKFASVGGARRPASDSPYEQWRRVDSGHPVTVGQWIKKTASHATVRVMIENPTVQIKAFLPSGNTCTWNCTISPLSQTCVVDSAIVSDGSLFDADEAFSFMMTVYYGDTMK